MKNLLHLSGKSRLVAVLVLSLAGILVFMFTQTTKQKGVYTPPPTEDSSQEMVVSIPDGSDFTETDDHLSKEYSFVVDPEVINNKAVPIATRATLAYLQQSSSEGRYQRAERLKSLFHPTSSIISDTPPRVDPSYSKDTVSEPSVLSTAWYIDGSYVVVSVDTNTKTYYQNSPAEKVADVYQKWDLYLLPSGGDFIPYFVEFNPEPIII